MKTITSIVAAGFLAAALNLPAPAGTDYRIAAYLWSPGLDSLTEQTGKMLEELGYPALPLSNQLKRTLGSALRNPRLRGVDLARPLAAVLLADRAGPDREPLFAFSIPLSNPRAFNQEISRYFPGRTEEDSGGIRIFTQEIKTLDTEAFRRAPESERKDLSRFYISRTETLAVAVRDKTALVSESRTAVEVLLEADPAELDPPIRENLTAVVNVENLGDNLIESTRGRAGPADLIPEAAAFRKIGDAFMETLVRQLKTLALGLTAERKGLTLTYAVEAEPGSPLGEFLRMQRPGPLALARYLDPAASLVVNSRLKTTPEWNRRLNEYLGGMMEAFAPRLEDQPFVSGDDLLLLSYPEQTEEVETAVSGRFHGPDDFSVVSVTRITPPGKYPAFESELFPVENVHREIEIRVYRPEGDARAEEKAGNGPEPRFSIRLAAVGGLLVSEIAGGRTRTEVPAAIDRILDRENIFELDRLPPCRNAASYVYLYHPGAAAEAMTDRRAPQEVSQILRRLERAGVSLGGCGIIRDNQVQYGLFVSTEEIRTIIDIFSQE